MNILKLAAGLALVALLSGCGTKSVLRPDANQQPSSEESIVVFGLNPHHTIHVVPGVKLPAGFERGAIDTPLVNGESTDGYLVAKLRPGQLMGLVTAFKTQGNEGNFLGTRAFTDCGNWVLVLEVPRAGRMYYVTDIEYTAVGLKLNARYGNRIGSAADYLNTKFPQLRGELEQLKFEFLPPLGQCGLKTPERRGLLVMARP